MVPDVPVSPVPLVSVYTPLQAHNAKETEMTKVVKRSGAQLSPSPHPREIYGGGVRALTIKPLESKS